MKRPPVLDPFLEELRPAAPATDPLFATFKAECDAKDAQRRELKRARFAYRQQHPRVAKHTKPRVASDKERICISCQRCMPIPMFSSSIVRGKAYIHKRCIQCRATVYRRSPTCTAKRKLIAHLCNKPCEDCQRVCPTEAMSLVHTRGEQSFPVMAGWTGRSRESIKLEALKCDVLCANCMKVRRSRERRRKRGYHRKLADLPPELANKVDLARRLAELYPGAAHRHPAR